MKDDPTATHESSVDAEMLARIDAARANPSPGIPHVQIMADIAGPLNTWDEDQCCARPLAKALRSGKLASTDMWTCPKCGMEWKAAMVETARRWSPVVVIQIWR